MEPIKHVVKLEGLAEGYSGTVTMNAPLNTERARVTAKSGIHKAREMPKENQEEIIDQYFEKQVPALLEIYESARPLMLEVDIKGPKGEVINDLEIFDRHPACAECYAEIAMAYAKGFGPGKRKSRN